MNSKLFSYLLISIFLFATTCNSVLGQNSLNAAGATQLNTSGSISYSFGQVFYVGNGDSQWYVNQGVQQPFVITDITKTEDDIQLHVTLKAFPNPTHNNLTLTISPFNEEDYTYSLSDSFSRILISKTRADEINSISMVELPPAVYLLHVFHNQKNIKTFKIIKN